jgi:UDP-N-acetylglucosamine 2-epimerase (non-hydrolysing)
MATQERLGPVARLASIPSASRSAHGQVRSQVVRGRSERATATIGATPDRQDADVTGQAEGAPRTAPQAHRQRTAAVTSAILSRSRRAGPVRAQPAEGAHAAEGAMAGTVAHVVGARPNFMKAAPVLRALAARGVEQRLIHTGQHYDRGLSGVFFDELDLPRPDIDLDVGSGSHAVQTAAVMVGLDAVFEAAAPALVVVYGDVNSTVAAALVCAKRRIALAHVEAGLRSFDPSMPEEINRRVTDQLSELLFVTSPEAIDNLRHEGLGPDGIEFVGNPMIDTLLANLDRFDAQAARRHYELAGPYAVATLHRPANVDGPEAAGAMVAMLAGASAILPIVLPLHPRGRASLEAAGLRPGPRLLIVEPLGYVAFMSLVRGAAVVVTDSGGIQEETTILGVPCLTVRRNTERPITISHGTNRLVEPDAVVAAVRDIIAGPPAPPSELPPLWDGHAGERVATVVERWLAARLAATA